MTVPDRYELILTPTAQPAVAERLPESIAAAVIDFMTTALVDNPQRVGKPLRDHLRGIWSARRGTYRILYRINDDHHEVVVLRVERPHPAQRHDPQAAYVVSTGETPASSATCSTRARTR